MEHWIDGLARRLGAATSRRQAIKVLAIGLVTGLVGAGRPRGADAQQLPCFHTQCKSYYWFDQYGSNPWIRYQCFQDQKVTSNFCNSPSFKQNDTVSNAPFQMSTGSPFFVVAQPGGDRTYSGPCNGGHGAIQWVQLQRRRGRVPGQNDNVFAASDGLDLDADRFATTLWTPDVDAMTMAKLADPAGSATGARDDRNPPECKVCTPPSYFLCGECVDPSVTCNGQKKDCCYADSENGDLHPGYWYAEGGICHLCG